MSNMKIWFYKFLTMTKPIKYTWAGPHLLYRIFSSYNSLHNHISQCHNQSISTKYSIGVWNKKCTICLNIWYDCILLPSLILSPACWLPSDLLLPIQSFNTAVDYYSYSAFITHEFLYYLISQPGETLNSWIKTKQI